MHKPSIEHRIMTDKQCYVGSVYQLLDARDFLPIVYSVISIGLARIKEFFRGKRGKLTHYLAPLLISRPLSHRPWVGEHFYRLRQWVNSGALPRLLWVNPIMCVPVQDVHTAHTVSYELSRKNWNPLLIAHSYSLRNRNFHVHLLFSY